MDMSTSIKNAFNKARYWFSLQTELAFPSKDTLSALQEKGWEVKNEFVHASAYGMGVVTKDKITTPEGVIATPGSDESERYEQEIKNIVRTRHGL